HAAAGEGFSRQALRTALPDPRGLLADLAPDPRLARLQEPSRVGRDREGRRMREGESESQDPTMPTSPAANLRELVKSMLGFSWAMSLFGLRSMANMVAPSRAAASLDAVKQAAEGELGGGLHGAFRAADQLQR